MYSEPANRQPPEVSTSGGLLFALGGVPFFSLVWAKKRSKRNSTATGWTHASSVLCPSPLPSVGGRSHGCAALYFEVAHPGELYR